MKKTFLLLCALAVAGCLPKMPEYAELESDRLRVLAVVFSPRPEAAPGDTMRAKAYFAGKAASGIDDYGVSFAIVKPDTFIDQEPLTIVSEKTWLPDSMEISFVIPDSLLFRDATGAPLAPGSAEKIRGLAADTSGCAAAGGSDGISLETALRPLYKESCLLFVMHATDGAALKVQSRFLVRYNSRFRQCMEVNENPEVSKVRLYSVEGKKLTAFDPAKPEFQGKFSSALLFSASSPMSLAETLRVSGDKSYFLAADSARPDFYTNNTGIREAETMKYTYFYEPDKTIGTDFDSVLVHKSPLSPIVKLNPPDRPDPYSIKIRLVVHDESGDAIRSKGFAVRTMTVVVCR
jgi:hypothetical protein